MHLNRLYGRVGMCYRMSNSDAMKNNNWAVYVVLAGAFICTRAGAALKTLPGHLPALVPHLAANGRLAAATQLNLAIGLPLHDSAGLDNFLAQVYDPASPLFHHFLTPAEFTARFGPTGEDYDAVKNFARTNGFVVTATYGNRLLLDVRGPASAVERAFHVTLKTYRHPTEARDFFAPDTEPAVDNTLPIADVSGLANYSRPHPMSHRSTFAITTKYGSAPNGFSYLGSDFRDAYVPGTSLDGTGQSVGLLEFEGYYTNDIVAYATLTGGGRTNIPVQPVYIDGFSGTPNPSDTLGIGEVSLDIEMAMSMAPGLSQIVVFEGNPSSFIPNDVLNVMAASNTVKNLSSSWGWSGGPSITTDNIFKTMAAQGQSYFNASGDSDAFTPGFVDNPNQQGGPSSNPYITQVGGTTLSTTGPGGAYTSETAWNWGFTGGKYVGTSGGVSSFYPVPAWQLGVNSFLTNGGLSTWRNIPDVALTADGVYVIYNNNTTANFGGTSCAAPLWAGFMALVNQQAAISGKPPVGFINPAVYEIANESIYSAAFHDVTTGNNTWPSSTNAYYAVPGYDLCTGIGTPAGTNLINALVNPDPLIVTPNAVFNAVSLAGAFPIAAQTFYLTNAGAVPLTWSLINTSSWLNVSSSGGTLAVGATNAVTVSLNLMASNLTSGTYTANLWFTNATTGVAHGRFCTLAVVQSLIQNGGFETADFTSWTLYGNTIIGNYVANAVESPSGPDHFNVAHSGTYGAFLGDNPLAILAQMLPTVPGKKYLLSFWLDNPIGGSGQQFLVNWNTNNPTTNTVFYVSNPGAFAWTNLNFVLTATGTNTMLQFGAQNLPNYFGLDDVSVTPIPAPAFSSVNLGANGFGFSWTSVPNVSYLVQYKTNLLQTSWLDLGSSLVAGTNTLTVVDTNSVQNFPQRFYRISIFP